jgi:DNA end-binding protein Ku
MANRVWKGFLSLGALSIPIHLCVAARDQRVELHSFHSECNGRVKSPKYCPACEKMLEPSEIYRGYDSGSGLVPITDEELDNITPSTEHQMEITECVQMSDIDVSYFAESFFMLPDPAGIKAYSLLTKTLKETGRVAITQITKSSREHTAIIRPKGNGLMLHYVFYQSEIARIPEFESLPMATLSANELKLANQLVTSMETDFNPEQYEDSYFQRLNTLIASKLDDKIAAPTPVKSIAAAPTQDLMAALTASLGQVKARRTIKVQEDDKSKGKKKKAA